jgi:LacI family transcriptional regulator
MPRPGLFCEYWELPLNGIRKAARELAHHIQIDYFFFDVANGAASFSEASELLLRAGLDGFILAPVLPEESTSFLTRVPPNLPYIFFDSYLPDMKPLTVIAQDCFQSGRVAGYLMSLLLPQGGEVIIVKNLPADYHIEAREKGFYEFVSEHHGLRAFSVEIDLADEGEHLADTIQGIRELHPNMKGLYVTNANTHPYARLNQGISSSERISCVGFDLIAKNLTCLREGTIDFLISQKPEDYGYQSITTLYRHLILKETVAPHFYSPIEIFCRENLL